MILYFSGTGNSRYVAQMLGELLSDEVHSLADELCRGESGDFYSEKPYIIVFPVYCWDMPRKVAVLIARSTFGGNKQTYFIATCGHWSGNTAKSMARLCRKSGLDFKGLATILMPANYIVMYEPPQPDRCREIVSDMNEPLAQAAEYIRAGSALPREQHQLKERLFSAPANALFYKLSMKDEGFHTTEKCNGCGICKKKCPLNNITLNDRRPHWNGNCTHCMGCICHCPQEAIEYKDRTAGRRRYRFVKELR